MSGNRKRVRIAEERIGSREKTPGTIAGIWVVLMLSLFPLIYTDYYYNILETKFITFCVLNLLLAAGLLVWGLSSGHLFAALKKKENALPFWKRLSAPDCFMLLFLLAAAVATANSSPYLWQAFSGIEGRYTGLFYIMMLAGVWFLITRFYRPDERCITVFLVSASVVALLGIADFYDKNLLHFKDEMREDEYEIFTSTIGNINTYVVLIGLFTALAGTLFVLGSARLLKRIFWYVTLLIAFFAITVGSSDNGYISLGAMFAFLPLLAFRTEGGLRRYLVLLATYVSVVCLVLRETTEKAGKVLRIDGMFRVFAKLPWLKQAAALLWALAGVMFLFSLLRGRLPGKGGGRGKEEVFSDRPLPVLLRLIWGAGILLAGVFLLSLLVKANAMEWEEARKVYGPMAEYLKFSDAWGTNRGYVWRAAWEEYKILPRGKQLTGTGPDTFGIYMMIHRWKEMQQKTGQIFDSAHNEYLQYLFTVGPLGLLAHVGILLSSVWSAFRSFHFLSGEGNDPERAAWFGAFAVMTLSYAFQAVVNINIPIATPVLWTFLMVSEAGSRELRHQTKKNGAKPVPGGNAGSGTKDAAGRERSRDGRAE